MTEVGKYEVEEGSLPLDAGLADRAPARRVQSSQRNYHQIKL